MKHLLFALSFVAVSSSGSSYAETQTEAPTLIGGVETVTVKQAKTLYDQGAVFIDVRDTPSWSMGHIDGALNLDLETNEFLVLYLSEDLDRNTPLVFYTASPLNVRSAMAVYFANQWGYRNVYYFREGYYAWISKDYPVELKLAGKEGQGIQSGRVANR